MRVLLPCDGAAGESWSAVTAASLSSERAGTELSEGGASGGVAAGGCVGTDSGSDTITLRWVSNSSGGEETSMSREDGEVEGDRRGREEEGGKETGEDVKRREERRQRGGWKRDRVRKDQEKR